MRISNHINMLEISGTHGLYYPVLLHDDENLILVDTGFPSQTELLREAIIGSGFKMEDINKIIFTHQDIDHIGCAKEIIASAPGVEVMAHVVEAPFIDGREVPVKLASMDKSNPFYAQFKAGFDNRRIAINRTLTDRELLPYCEGIEIIHTPGHTPGHICLYIAHDKVLIAGDALNIKDGLLAGANPQHSYNIMEAEESITRLQQYDINCVLTYHGGKYDGGLSQICSL